MMVVYSSNDEVLVMTAEDEQDMIDEYFTEGGRDLEDYDREIVRDGLIRIRNRFLVETDSL